ncbi:MULTISPECIES: M4 family metallopeptidase [Pseudomonas]|uniref:Neutral metalloproteinase n=2 Tax=Pseudomonadaceae TaxID=135621 RepID=A0A0D0J3U7_9PSED|nr:MULTISPECIES: M4 family metallopeptidase [Pseudomonas]KIQ00193.1 peptidase M4 [Pseudomonas fulva]MCW2292258.1 Zn-dependent metalloprotease [Pseudomonas sp. BIGb0408]NYH73170.1 Zn-dependent metalloprotease [Pseudomonas flavescens]
MNSCLVPPYILDRIIGHGTERQRDCARSTLNHVNSLRHNNGAPRLATQQAGRSAVQAGQPQRSIHDAGQDMRLPGELSRSEGQAATGDVAVDEAYEALGATYAFFWEVLGRHSIDGQGFALVGTVHYGQAYENAFWNGEQMVFGDGDGEIFNRFTIALDVVAHELTHGVIDTEAALAYVNQSGALNESLSDVFGILTKQYTLQQTAEQSDWIIGAGLLTDAVNGNGLRSMSAPGSAYDDPLLGKDPQPGHMRDFVDTREDNGGVHINSGIPNRAFHLAAIALGGFAWEKAGLIWYDTLCDGRLSNDASFVDFASLCVNNAEQRYGQGSREALAVSKAWQDVGVEAAS